MSYGNHLTRNRLDNVDEFKRRHWDARYRDDWATMGRRPRWPYAKTKRWKTKGRK